MTPALLRRVTDAVESIRSMTWNVIKRVKGQFSFLLNTTGVIRYWKQTSSSLVHEDVIWWRLDEQEANFLWNFPSSLTNKLHLLQGLLFSRKRSASWAVNWWGNKSRQELLDGCWTLYQRTNMRHHTVTSQRLILTVNDRVKTESKLIFTKRRTLNVSS